MKILIRRWDNKSYVWRDATWEKGKYFVECDDGFRFDIDPTEILAIKADNRVGKVVCKNCGEIIDNNAEAIEKHFADREAQRDCLKCKNLATYGHMKVVDVSYVKNEDGTYRETRTADTGLRCKMMPYTVVDINSRDAARVCMYNQCRFQGVEIITDFFTEFPDAFDKQLTVDMLNKKECQYEGYNGDFFVYDLNVRGAIKACVNELGIIDHFLVLYRGSKYKAYYSHRYSMLFFGSSRNGYMVNTPGSMSEARHTLAKSKIESLYKEANVNE
jgi:hypothetical protein